MITGVVLARNEEANIVDCFKTLQPHCNELILIDMESSDRTIELARPFVQHVLPHPLVPRFDAARNLAIPVAKNDWIWFLDADERIPQRTGELVKQLIQTRGTEFEAITIPFKSYFCDRWIEHSGWWPGYTMPRVLKRGKFQFSERLHGGVQVDGREIRVQPDPAYGIDHYSYRSIEHYLEKLNRYTSTEASHLKENGVAWNWRQACQVMFRDLWLYYERNHGLQDGLEGWILAWLSGQYRWLSHAKLALQGDRPRKGDIPNSLDEVLDCFADELQGLRRQPQLPIGVIWKSPLEDPSGYADEGRFLLKSLAGGNREILAENITWSDRRCELPTADRRLLKLLYRAKTPKHAVVVTNCIPTLVEPDLRGAANILRTTFEIDRIPENWLPRLERFDQIWTMSNFDREAFIRSGVAPEKLRVLTSGVDVECFTPTGDQFPLPESLQGKFVFLSIFDWQLRKGWDVLLRSYVRAFPEPSDQRLLLKVSGQHGYSPAKMREQANAILEGLGCSLESRPDIVWMHETHSQVDLAALYRSCHAFVLPTRGEGFGRPLLEALACQLPVISTVSSGPRDFLREENSFPVASRLVPVPPAAFHEISVYRGGQWYEPVEEDLVRQLQTVFSNDELRTARATQGRRDTIEKYSSECAERRLETALGAIESRWKVVSPPAPGVDQLRVCLEGEFFATHSFANVNEQLAREFLQREEIALRLERKFHQPTFDEQSPLSPQLKPWIGTFAEGPQVTIRHAFPPNWERPAQGKWVHIQPWEFGSLPTAWIAPLRDLVDEIWVPSEYVAEVYRRSGIPAAKIQVIPWGVDPNHYHPDFPARNLPTAKSFRFLFVGGTIHRKGFDLLLQAYLEEFRREDDVCLVIKDLGTNSFYRGHNAREQILVAQQDQTAPEILYLEDAWTTGQLAALYRACDCLAAPYRGEGFGMPILEAMACGTTVIVPQGGPSDDFVTPETGFILPCRTVTTTHDWPLCGPATLLEVEITTLRQTLRAAFQDQKKTHEMGLAAAAHVQSWTWEATAKAMRERFEILARPKSRRGQRSVHNATPRELLTACLAAPEDPLQLAETLSRIRPFLDQVVVILPESKQPHHDIIREYGGRAIIQTGFFADTAKALLKEVRTPWYVLLEPQCSWSEAILESLCSQVASAISREIPKLTLANGETLALHPSAAQALSPSSSEPACLTQFYDHHWPHLGIRAATFERALRILTENWSDSALIVETGCVRRPNDWSAGQSTVVFDAYLRSAGGRLISVDLDPQNCAFARRLCGPQTQVVHQDSITFLHEHSLNFPLSIDLLYLDSLDLDWQNPHLSALHQLQEFTAAQPALKPGALILLDDHQNESGVRGKSIYLVDYLQRIGATVVEEGYQILFELPRSRESR